MIKCVLKFLLGFVNLGRRAGKRVSRSVESRSRGRERTLCPGAEPVKGEDSRAIQSQPA